MKPLIRAAIVNRKTTAFLIFASLVLGIYNYVIMPRQEAPDFVAPYAILTTIWPGASPEEIEKELTEKIEDMAAEVPDMEMIQSISRNSASIVVLKLNAGTDIDAGWDILKDKASTLQRTFPDGASDIQINTELTDTAGMLVALSGENYSYEELAAYAEKVGRELGKLDGVARFEVVGDQERYLQVQVDTARLNQLGLSLSDLVKILAAENMTIPVGSLRNDTDVINVSPSGAYESEQDISDQIVTISPETGAAVRLKDIAEIGWTYEDTNVRIKRSGENAVLLTGYFKEDLNVVSVGRAVKARIDELRPDLPADLSFEPVMFQPDTVEKSVNSFIENLLEALVLIVVIVFLGMGFRNAIIASFSIPLTVALAFSIMKFLGVEIHQISITALIIALGMVVDDSIVVNDAIQLRIDRGESRLDACINGVLEVNVPVLTSTLTTVGAFLPLLMLGGTAGDYIRAIPLVVIVSLVSSYFVAILVIPMLAYLFLGPSHERVKKNRMRSAVVRLCRASMKRRWIPLLLAAAVIAGTLALALSMNVSFFPMAETDMIYLNIEVESAVHLDETEAVVRQIGDILDRQPEVTGWTAAIGSGLPKFYTTLGIMSQSVDVAQIMMKVDLKKGGRFETNTWFVKHLQDQIDRTVATATVSVKELEQGDPTGAPIMVKLSADDMDTLAEAAERVKAELAKMPGATKVEDDLPTGVFEFDLAIDPVQGMYRGLTMIEIEQEAGIALRGADATSFTVDGEDVPVKVKSDIRTKEALGNLMIKSAATGEKVLMKDVSEIRLEANRPLIRREGRELSVSISAFAQPGTSAVSIQRAFAQKLKTMDLTGVSVSYEGEGEKIREYFGDMGLLSLFALLIIFAVMLVQFNSFTQPFIIFATIPLSLIGSIIGLAIFRQPISFTGVLGMISLMGLVVRNAIVLIDYTNEALKRGVELKEACVAGVERRFRPILLTTLTTVIGFIPLVISGGELFRPLSIAIMFGLIVSMALTLVIIPVTFSLVERPRRPAEPKQDA